MFEVGLWFETGCMFELCLTGYMFVGLRYYAGCMALGRFIVLPYKFGVLRHFVGVLFGNEIDFDRLESLGFDRLIGVSGFDRLKV